MIVPLHPPVRSSPNRVGVGDRDFALVASAGQLEAGGPGGSGRIENDNPVLVARVGDDLGLGLDGLTAPRRKGALQIHPYQRVRLSLATFHMLPDRRDNSSSTNIAVR